MKKGLLLLIPLLMLINCIKVMDMEPILLSSYSVHFLAGEECVIDVLSDNTNE